MTSVSKYRGKLKRLAGVAPPKHPPQGYKINLTKEGDSHEYFAIFDQTADVWEIFLDEAGETYIGCANYLKDAATICDEHEEENKP